MIGVSRLPSVQQLAVHTSNASFTQLLTPSEHILHNALLTVVFKFCEAGSLDKDFFEGLVQAWSGLSQHLSILPPEGEQGESRGSADLEVDGANTGRADGEGRDENRGDEEGDVMDVDPLHTGEDVEPLPGSSSGQKCFPPTDLSQRLRSRPNYQPSSHSHSGARRKRRAVERPREDNGDEENGDNTVHDSDDDGDRDLVELHQYTLAFHIPDLIQQPTPLPPIALTSKKAIRPTQSEKVSLLVIHYLCILMFLPRYLLNSFSPLSNSFLVS